jgi:hypothetical protein
LVEAGPNNSWSVFPVVKPKLFDAAVVIFSKRDAGEVTRSAFLADWRNNLPTAERAMAVRYISPEALTAGAFEIDLDGPNTGDPQYRLKPGDWLMMSRMSPRYLIPGTAVFFRQVHRWYRIVSVESKETFPVRVRVVGKPWAPTDGEVQNSTVPILLPQLPNSIAIQAVVLKDVIQVYEHAVAVD